MAEKLTLENIFKEYKDICFLVRDSRYNRKEVEVGLLAKQNLISRYKIQQLFLGIIDSVHATYNINCYDILRKKVFEL